MSSDSRNKILQGDCLELLKTLPENSVDSIVTDPPYELGFMGKSWDSTGIAYNKLVWVECLRVLKPGGHLLAFGGSRTYHRLACAIEDAGFEIRDQIMWLYGSGFPKSLNIGKQIDKMQGNERKIIGKANRYLDGAIRKVKTGFKKDSEIYGNGEVDSFKKVTKGNSIGEGWGSALKPAHEPIVVARKPLSEKNIASNVLKWGTGGINIDACRIGTEKIESGRHGRAECISESFGKKLYGTKKEFNQGRFPANIILDEEAGRLLGEPSRFFYCAKANKRERNEGCEDIVPKKMDECRKEGNPGGDNPRNRGVHQRANHHPTVKPIKLMRYLIRLVTPKDGIVLDPFIGSGTTGIAAIQEGFNFIGMEQSKEYIEIANARLKSFLNQRRLL